MNKQIPTINKIIQFQDLKRNWLLHQNKIKNIKPTLTTRTQNDLKSRICLNKTAKQPFGNTFSRMIDIQFENKALLKKLTQKKILKPNGNINSSFQNVKYENEPVYRLVKNNRKRYFQQHSRRLQNEGLLRRIKQTKPLYQMQKYMTERRTNQKYINSISKFGYKNYKPNKTILKFQMISQNNSKFKCFQNDNTDQLQLNQGNKQNIQRGNLSQQMNLKKKNINVKSLVKIKKPNQIKNQKQTKQRLLYKYNNIDSDSSQQQSDSKVEKINPQQRNKSNARLANQNNLIRNNSSILKSDRSSKLFDNSNQNMDMHPLSVIPQKEIKINGINFLLKGINFINRIRLQILQLNHQSLGNQYIHQVQIPISVYNSKFQGRIDLLIKNLKFDKNKQTFFIK